MNAPQASPQQADTSQQKHISPNQPTRGDIMWGRKTPEQIVTASDEKARAALAKWGVDTTDAVRAFRLLDAFEGGTAYAVRRTSGDVTVYSKRPLAALFSQTTVMGVTNVALVLSPMAGTVTVGHGGAGVSFRMGRHEAQAFVTAVPLRSSTK